MGNKHCLSNTHRADIISFGEVARNSKLLQKLYLAVNSNDTSHLVEVAENNASLTRVVMQSSVVAVDLPSAASMDFSGIDGGSESLCPSCISMCSRGTGCRPSS